MTNSDLFVTAIEEARAITPTDWTTGGVDAFLRCADDWSPVRLTQECVTLASEISAATQSVLYTRERDTMRCLAMCPPRLESPLAVPQDVDTFPWDMGSLMASRFVLVDDASTLVASTGSLAGTTLGELDLTSAVHLPLWAGNRAMGALILYWTERISQWDDRPGALLRALGVFTLDRLSRASSDSIRTAPRRL